MTRHTVGIAVGSTICLVLGACAGLFALGPGWSGVAMPLLSCIVCAVLGAVAWRGRLTVRAAAGILAATLALVGSAASGRWLCGEAKRRAVAAVQDGRTSFTLLGHTFNERAHVTLPHDNVDFRFVSTSAWYFVVVTYHGGEYTAWLAD